MKRELQYSRYRGALSYIEKKIAMKGKSTNRLDYKKGTYSKKSTLSYDNSNKRGRDETFKALTLGLQN